MEGIIARRPFTRSLVLGALSGAAAAAVLALGLLLTSELPGPIETDLFARQAAGAPTVHLAQHR